MAWPDHPLLVPISSDPGHFGKITGDIAEARKRNIRRRQEEKQLREEKEKEKKQHQDLRRRFLQDKYRGNLDELRNLKKIFEKSYLSYRELQSECTKYDLGSQGKTAALAKKLKTFLSDIGV